MRVLFVYRSHRDLIKNPIVKNQSESLSKLGIDIDFFPLTKGGLFYFRNYLRLKKYLKVNKFDIVHAHYGYSAIIAGLANKRKTVASLMGSDIYNQFWIIRFFTKMFAKNVWKQTIVKSLKMNSIVNNSIVIPNGVDLDLFKQMDKANSKSKVGFVQKYNIVFVAVSPDEKVKNLVLAKNAIALLNDTNIQLHLVNNIESNMLSYYYSAADLLILTSISEGSPNVIKEAMACNCPIVSTDVGDVKKIIGDTEGCYICSYEPEDVANKIKLALAFSEKHGRTKGRNRIINLGLDSESIAKKILKVYDEVISDV